MILKSPDVIFGPLVDLLLLEDDVFLHLLVDLLLLLQNRILGAHDLLDPEMELVDRHHVLSVKSEGPVVEVDLETEPLLTLRASVNLSQIVLFTAYLINFWPLISTFSRHGHHILATVLDLTELGLKARIVQVLL